MSAQPCTCPAGECSGPLGLHGEEVCRKLLRALGDPTRSMFEADTERAAVLGLDGGEPAVDSTAIPSLIQVPQPTLDRLNAEREDALRDLTPEARERFERMEGAVEDLAIGRPLVDPPIEAQDRANAKAERELFEGSGPPNLRGILSTTEEHHHTPDVVGMFGEMRDRIMGEQAKRDQEASAIVISTAAGEDQDGGVREMFRDLAGQLIEQAKADLRTGAVRTVWGFPVKTDAGLDPGTVGVEFERDGYAETMLLGGRRGGRRQAFLDQVREAARQALIPHVHVDPLLPDADHVYAMNLDATPWLGVDPARRDRSAVTYTIPRPVIVAPRFDRAGYPHRAARAAAPTPGYTRHTLGAREAARARRRAR